MRSSGALDLGRRLFGELAGETTAWLILVGSSSDRTTEHYSTAADTYSKPAEQPRASRASR